MSSASSSSNRLASQATMATPPEVHRLSLAHPLGSCRIRVGEGVLAGARDELATWLDGRTLFVLTTEPVWELHGGALADLTAAAGTVHVLEVEDGEGAKQVRHAERLWKEMLTAGGKRDSRLLTFGGGTVGDLGGFVAGCFLRGIDYVQCPTTLLAQVDASVGGKTGVDLEGKNTVGLFHHPRWILSDTSLLATLPVGELRSGLVEVVKMAALLDPPLLERVEQDLEALLCGDASALGPVVAAAAAAKCAVVESDPIEGDHRRILNFGHTLGHAIEGALAYQSLRHGEAVAYGILFASRLAARRFGDFDRDLGDRLSHLLARFEMPDLPPLEAAELARFMTRDKKATEKGLVWVLPRGLGRGEMVSGIATTEVLAELETFLREPWAGL